MPLSLKQLQDVCLLYANDHKKCKYLAEDDPGVWFCLKKSPKRADIDDEIDDYIRDAKNKGINPTKQGMPLGDNCSGYPILRYIKQGYDQK